MLFCYRSSIRLVERSTTSSLVYREPYPVPVLPFLYKFMLVKDEMTPQQRCEVAPLHSFCARTLDSCLFFLISLWVAVKESN